MKEALKLALEALENMHIVDFPVEDLCNWNKAITAIKEALEKPEQEPIFTLDYLQGHQDGLDWAAELVVFDDPRTGDWMYDDRHDLANAIHRGPEMPKAQPEQEPVAWMNPYGGLVHKRITGHEKNNFTIPLYTHPPVPTTQPEPLDTPLPCDVKVGHVTIRKGVALSVLIARMQVLYDMAQPKEPEQEQSGFFSREAMKAHSDFHVAQPEQEPEGNPYDDQRRSMEQAFKEPEQDGWKMAAEYWYRQFRIARFGKDQESMNFKGALDSWFQYYINPEGQLAEVKDEV